MKVSIQDKGYVMISASNDAHDTRLTPNKTKKNSSLYGLYTGMEWYPSGLE